MSPESQVAIVEAVDGTVTAMECDCCDEVTVGLIFRLEDGRVIMVDVPVELAEKMAAELPGAIANRMPAINGSLDVPVPAAWTR